MTSEITLLMKVEEIKKKSHQLKKIIKNELQPKLEDYLVNALPIIEFYLDLTENLDDEQEINLVTIEKITSYYTQLEEILRNRKLHSKTEEVIKQIISNTSPDNTSLIIYDLKSRLEETKKDLKFAYKKNKKLTRMLQNNESEIKYYKNLEKRFSEEKTKNDKLIKKINQSQKIISQLSKPIKIGESKENPEFKAHQEVGVTERFYKFINEKVPKYLEEESFSAVDLTKKLISEGFDTENWLKSNTLYAFCSKYLRYLYKKEIVDREKQGSSMIYSKKKGEMKK